MSDRKMAVRIRAQAKVPDTLSGKVTVFYSNLVQQWHSEFNDENGSLIAFATWPMKWRATVAESKLGDRIEEVFKETGSLDDLKGNRVINLSEFRAAVSELMKEEREKFLHAVSCTWARSEAPDES